MEYKLGLVLTEDHDPLEQPGLSLACTLLLVHLVSVSWWDTAQLSSAL